MMKIPADLDSVAVCLSMGIKWENMIMYELQNTGFTQYSKTKVAQIK